MPETVTLFALGGTIAAVADSRGRNASMHLTGDDIVSGISELADASLDVRTFRTSPSASLSIEDIVELAHEIDRAAETSSGIVVTQGTDTLEECAWMLDLLVQTDAPVVVTGAMRNAGRAGADGPANLVAAVAVASSPLARGLGTLVVFADEIHAARFVRKTHSSSPGTFRSSNVGAIGWITEGRVRIPLVPRARTGRITLRPERTDSVALYRLSLGDDGRALEALAAAYDALVIETFGGGHVPASFVPALSGIAARQPVVFTSRTGAGELYTATGDFAGSEQDLLRAGLVSAVALDGPKARILLTLLLRSGADRDAIAAAFAATAD